MLSLESDRLLFDLNCFIISSIEASIFDFTESETFRLFTTLTGSTGSVLVEKTCLIGEFNVSVLFNVTAGAIVGLTGLELSDCKVGLDTAIIL